MSDLKWYVSFASAGCLPDDEPVEFDTQAEAEAYADAEWAEFTAEGVSEHNLYSYEVYQA